MAEATNIPSFLPSSEWYEDWPFGEDTSAQVEACVTGSAADHAVEAFLEPLTHDPDAEVREATAFITGVGSPLSLCPWLTGSDGRSSLPRRGKMASIP